MRAKQRYEEGFLILLLVLAIVGLLWLFSPFLEALLFAMILATATYRLYLWVLPQVKSNETTASGLMSLAVFITVIAPVSYLLVAVSLEISDIYSQAQAWLLLQTPETLASLNAHWLQMLGIEGANQQKILLQIKAHATDLISMGQQAAVFLVQGVLGSATSFVSFIALSVFALFFFYRDGHRIAQHLKVLSPLENYYDTLIMNRFASLSTVLLLSILGVAILQGVSFVILAWAVGLPALFIGMAVAVTSFIPIVGAALVWVPMTIYLGLNEHYVLAGLVIFWGAVINGFVIDNLVRPILIQKISGLLANQGRNDLAVANHTLITVLSTFAGLIHFGMIGLFFGPVMAAMAITILDVYEHKNSDLLDRS